MFRQVKPESRRELTLLARPRDHDIFNTRTIQPVTDKITNGKYENQFTPRYQEISSRERYINNFYSPKHQREKTPRIRRSPKKQQYETINISAYDIKCRDMYNNCNATDYKMRRSKSVFNEKFRDNKYNDILKTTRNSRVRKLFAMSSDIFNLNNTSTNVIAQKTIKPDNYSRNKKTIHLGNESNYVHYRSNRNLNKIKRNKYIKLNKSSREEEKNLISSDNQKKLMKEKLETFNSKVDSKQFNRSSYLLRKDYNQANNKPLFNMNRKTNLSNISSVNYNIISTDPNSNINDKYEKLSNIKPTPSDYENYEIIIPKNFNKINESKIKNILHSQGLHYFDFKTDADIVGGEKGKYTFNIRKSDLEKNNNINKAIKKLEEKYNIKMKTNKIENKKRGSEITMKYGPEKVVNHLRIDGNNSNRYGKKKTEYPYDMKYKNMNIFMNEKCKERKNVQLKKKK